MPPITAKSPEFWKHHNTCPERATNGSSFLGLVLLLTERGLAAESGIRLKNEKIRLYFNNLRSYINYGIYEKVYYIKLLNCDFWL
jgi:hypothetical protein